MKRIVRLAFSFSFTYLAKTGKHALQYDSDRYIINHLSSDVGTEGAGLLGDFIGSGREYDWKAMGEEEILHSLEVNRL